MSTNEHERGPHGGLKCIKAHARTEKKLYTLPGRYLAPFSSRTRPKSVTVSRPSRAQYVFLSLNLVYPALRLSTRAFLGRKSRICGWRICEKQKNLPYQPSEGWLFFPAQRSGCSFRRRSSYQAQQLFYEVCYPIGYWHACLLRTGTLSELVSYFGIVVNFVVRLRDTRQSVPGDGLEARATDSNGVLHHRSSQSPFCRERMQTRTWLAHVDPPLFRVI